MVPKCQNIHPLIEKSKLVTQEQSFGLNKVDHVSCIFKVYIILDNEYQNFKRMPKRLGII